MVIAQNTLEGGEKEEGDTEVLSLYFLKKNIYKNMYRTFLFPEFFFLLTH